MENKRTLWVFGDSHTAGHGCTPIFEYYQKYYKEGDKLWSEYLAQYLKIELINRARNGASNDLILDNIIDVFDAITKGDIVIIGKTYSHRFDVPQKDGLNSIFWDWEEFAMDDIRSQFTLEQRKCIMDFQYYFMLSPLFDERWNKRYKWIMNRLVKKGCKVIVWDVVKELKGIETIQKATKKKIDDGHMSFKGHLDFANHMWNKWFKEKTVL
jgi:hypothetical protein